MDRLLGDTIYILFTTRSFATGIPTTLAGTPIVSAYLDGSITQITAGITLSVDHDGVAGLNLLTIVATTANGFTVDTDYNLVITAGTVSGVSAVGETVGTFSLERSAAYKAITPQNNLWNWLTAITATDPGAGNLKGDNAAIASITNLYTNELSLSDFNSSSGLLNLEIDDTFTMQVDAAGVNHATFTIRAAVVDNGGWFTIPVNFVETTGTIANNDTMIVGLAYSGIVKRQDAAALISTEPRLAELDQVNLPADVASRMAEASINTTAGAIDNVTLTDTAIITGDNVKTETANIQSRIPAALIGGRIDANASAINNDAVSAVNLSKSTRALIAGTCTGVPTLTNIPTDITVSDGVLVGRTVYFIIAGSALNDSSKITANTGGTLTIAPLVTAPTAGNQLVVA